MVVEKELIREIFGNSSVDTALEILCDEGHIFCSMAKSAETIETDVKKAYLEYQNTDCEKSLRHMIFCGNPCTFLEKKIDEGVRPDLIVVNTDRIRKAGELWKLIGQLMPSRVILGYREPGNGIYNKQLMVKNGFQIMKQEVKINDAISEKFCVGSSYKCNSD